MHYLEPIYYEEYKELNTTELAKMVRTRIERKVKEHLSKDNQIANRELLVRSYSS